MPVVRSLLPCTQLFSCLRVTVGPVLPTAVVCCTRVVVLELNQLLVTTLSREPCTLKLEIFCSLSPKFKKSTNTKPTPQGLSCLDLSGQPLGTAARGPPSSYRPSTCSGVMPDLTRLPLEPRALRGAARPWRRVKPGQEAGFCHDVSCQTGALLRGLEGGGALEREGGCCKGQRPKGTDPLFAYKSNRYTK